MNNNTFQQQINRLAHLSLMLVISLTSAKQSVPNKKEMQPVVHFLLC